MQFEQKNFNNKIKELCSQDFVLKKLLKICASSDPNPIFVLKTRFLDLLKN